MIDAGDLDLTAHEIHEIEKAGRHSAVRAERVATAKKVGRGAAAALLVTYGVYMVYQWI